MIIYFMVLKSRYLIQCLFTNKELNPLCSLCFEVESNTNALLRVPLAHQHIVDEL